MLLLVASGFTAALALIIPYADRPHRPTSSTASNTDDRHGLPAVRGRTANPEARTRTGAAVRLLPRPHRLFTPTRGRNPIMTTRDSDHQRTIPRPPRMTPRLRACRPSACSWAATRPPPLPSRTSTAVRCDPCWRRWLTCAAPARTPAPSCGCCWPTPAPHLPTSLHPRRARRRRPDCRSPACAPPTPSATSCTDRPTAGRHPATAAHQRWRRDVSEGTSPMIRRIGCFVVDCDDCDDHLDKDELGFIVHFDTDRRSPRLPRPRRLDRQRGRAHPLPGLHRPPLVRLPRPPVGRLARLRMPRGHPRPRRERLRPVPHLRPMRRHRHRHPRAPADHRPAPPPRSLTHVVDGDSHPRHQRQPARRG